MRVFLNEHFSRLWQRRDPFAEVLALDGVEYRNKEGRRTFQLQIEGHSYFAKVHRGVGWAEVIKNLLHLRLPIIGASNEYYAANKLAALQVDTLTPVAFGKRGLNPARQLSFILTEDLVNTVSLEDYCADWCQSPPTFAHKRALIKLLASVSRTMHGAGINHRDYYLCHFLLHRESIATETAPRCSLIDLHRAQLRRRTPRRWSEKDIAGLYFSALDIGLTQRDLLRFMCGYEGVKSIRELDFNNGFWRTVQQKAFALYRKEHPQRDPV